MKKKKTLNRIIMIIIILIGIIIISYPYFKPRKTVWCYFEVNNMENIPRHECIYLKMISREIEKVDFEGFLCDKSYEDMPPCSGEEYYFTQMDLNELGEDKIDGTICAAYHTTFYEWNDTNAESKRDIYRMQDFKERADNPEELKKLIIDCEV